MSELPNAIELKWIETDAGRQWSAFYNVGTYRITQIKGGVFPRYVLTFETHELSDLDHAKRMAVHLAATKFGAP